MTLKNIAFTAGRFAIFAFYLVHRFFPDYNSIYQKSTGEINSPRVKLHGARNKKKG
jgi:hypothetical protein